MTLKNCDILQTKATFFNLASLLREAQKGDVTGRIRVDWNARDERLEQWVGDEILPAKILHDSTGFLMLRKGRIVGAKIGGSSAADLEESLDTIMQLCYGIGCGVLASTVLTLSEGDLAENEAVGALSEAEMPARLSAIEKRMRALQSY